MTSNNTTACANCGHKKNEHSPNSNWSCIAISKVEDCNIPLEAKRKYLACGIKELPDCDCKEFKPLDNQESVKGVKNG